MGNCCRSTITVLSEPQPASLVTELRPLTSLRPFRMIVASQRPSDFSAFQNLILLKDHETYEPRCGLLVHFLSPQLHKVQLIANRPLVSPHGKLLWQRCYAPFWAWASGNRAEAICAAAITIKHKGRVFISVVVSTTVPTSQPFISIYAWVDTPQRKVLTGSNPPQ